jgi:hypothetical protein
MKGRIILKWILKKQGMTICDVFNFLGIRTRHNIAVE